MSAIDHKLLSQHHCCSDFFLLLRDCTPQGDLHDHDDIDSISGLLYMARRQLTLLPGGKSSLHGIVEGLAICLDLALGLLQHVAEVGMHILAYILHRCVYRSIHQCNELLLQSHCPAQHLSKKQNVAAQEAKSSIVHAEVDKCRHVHPQRGFGNAEG